jgi:hypothetical protein
MLLRPRRSMHFCVIELNDKRFYHYTIPGLKNTICVDNTRHYNISNSQECDRNKIRKFKIEYFITAEWILADKIIVFK